MSLWANGEISEKSLCPITTKIMPIPFAISTYRTRFVTAVIEDVNLPGSTVCVSWIIHTSLQVDSESWKYPGSIWVHRINHQWDLTCFYISNFAYMDPVQNQHKK